MANEDSDLAPGYYERRFGGRNVGRGGMFALVLVAVIAGGAYFLRAPARTGAPTSAAHEPVPVKQARPDDGLTPEAREAVMRTLEPKPVRSEALREAVKRAKEEAEQKQKDAKEAPDPDRDR
jgi:hypothetical protein